jgi:metallo-beta-lactamase family protein
MHVTLLGAAKEVTGSCYLVETDSATVLVDCGLFQGPPRLEKLNKIPRALMSKHIDAVVLTHAHLDHCGRLPMLCNSGYRGPIYATRGTIDLASLILKDAARIQEDDCERENRKRKNLSVDKVRPLFTHKDVEKVALQFRELNYEHWLDVADGVKIRLVEAGHIMGSSCVDMLLGQNGGRRRLVFSGDLGQWDMPILRDPAKLETADLIFVESTYGNRDHRSLEDTIDEFQQLILSAVQDKGKILIPTFAVGRTQQLLFHLSEMVRAKKLESFPIYLDSPMAIEATRLYKSHPELMDKEAQQLFKEHPGLLDQLFGLKTCQTSDESKALNAVPGPCLIMAGAGMCDAGRILHHFRQNLPLRETVVIIVGYQSKGSLGRNLIEGYERVKIFGETVTVRATVKSLGGFSAHAGQKDLLRWLEPMTRHNRYPRIILTHGEPNVMNEFAREIESRFEITPELPALGERITC